MRVNGLPNQYRPGASGPARLPARVPGAPGIPDGPVAVLPSIERLEYIAHAVRRWCAETDGPDGHR